jgi:mRNA interferase MazF
MSTWAQGEVLLAFLPFSDGLGGKRRPVLVVHDFGDADLLVVPVTSHPARLAADVILTDWKGAGLRIPSTVRVGKLATIEKSCIVRKLGALPPDDALRFGRTLADLWKLIQRPVQT